VFTCPSDKQKVLKTAPDFGFEEYEDVVEQVVELYDKLLETDRAAAAAMMACLVRLAGHDFMDFRYDL